jgi:uncharacterized protein YfiM (DUF2279 family)
MKKRVGAVLEAVMGPPTKVAKFFLAAALVLNAGMLKADNWHGEDKQAHFFLVGALPAIIIAGQTESRALGFAAGFAAGLTKEVLDSKSRASSFSSKDLIWTAAGAALGAYTGHWMVTRNERGTTMLTWSGTF